MPCLEFCLFQYQAKLTQSSRNVELNFHTDYFSTVYDLSIKSPFQSSDQWNTYKIIRNVIIINHSPFNPLFDSSCHLHKTCKSLKRKTHRKKSIPSKLKFRLAHSNVILLLLLENNEMWTYIFLFSNQSESDFKFAFWMENIAHISDSDSYMCSFYGIFLFPFQFVLLAREKIEEAGKKKPQQ